MALPHPLKACFPPEGLPAYPLPCPPVGSPSSAFTKRICYYIHEYILRPFSKWYMKHYNLPTQTGIFLLPFGLILKRHGRVHEQEGLAMNLARTMGVPAPRFISFGSLGVRSACPSLLMTSVPGYPLDWFDPGQVDLHVVAADLTRILARMRSYANPHGAAVCGVAGREIRGPMVPASPLEPFADEDAFKARLRAFVTNVRMEIFTEGVKSEDMEATLGRHRARVEMLETCLFAPSQRHAIVFTHGDLNMQNIMIGPDGHVCGIIDWEAAAWLPEYWEFSITAIVETLPWGKFMDKMSGGVYEQELKGHQALFPYVSGSFSYY